MKNVYAVHHTGQTGKPAIVLAEAIEAVPAVFRKNQSNMSRSVILKIELLYERALE